MLRNLIGRAKPKELAEETDVADVSDVAHLNGRDLERTSVLYCNHRTGSNLTRSILSSAAGVWSPSEPFIYDPSQEIRPELYLTHKILGDPEFAQLAATSPREATNEFLAQIYALAPPNAPVLIDLKYTQAYRLGVDHLTGVPQLLSYFVSRKLPVIHLIRSDFVAQAVSHLLALKTGIFSIYHKNPNERSQEFEKTRAWLKPKDVLELALAKREMTTQATYWLNTLGARTMILRYEDIASENAVESTRDVLEFIGHYAEIPDQPESETRKQSSWEKVSNYDEILAYVRSKDPTLG